MKTVGLIAEYNPLHNGHVYHMERARELTGADYVVVVMSGDFVQRGAPAVYDKYTRAGLALEAGADLVLELPAVFATSSAEDFASCGIALLDKLGVVDSLCFGSECGRLEPLSSIADSLIRESKEYTDELKKWLKSGCSFPKARDLAVTKLTGLSGLLTAPNNILGVEYLKALKRRKSSIQPVTITRADPGYHGTELSGGLCSAKAVRRALAAIPSAGQEGRRELISGIAAAVPGYVRKAVEMDRPLWADDFSPLLNYALLSLTARNRPLEDFADLSEALAAGIGRSALEFASFEQRISRLKSRQYTYTRISRALLHLLLGIRSEEVRRFRSQDYAGYARVLGFRRDSAPLLKQIKAQGSVPLITKTADAGRILSPRAMELFQKDLCCSHVYQSVYQSKYGERLPNEYTRRIIPLDPAWAAVPPASTSQPPT